MGVSCFNAENSAFQPAKPANFSSPRAGGAKQLSLSPVSVTFLNTG